MSGSSRVNSFATASSFFSAVASSASACPRSAANGWKIFARASMAMRGCFIRKFQSFRGYGRSIMSV